MRVALLTGDTAEVAPPTAGGQGGPYPQFHVNITRLPHHLTPEMLNDNRSKVFKDRKPGGSL
jgi:hypothetical protein